MTDNPLVTTCKDERLTNVKQTQNTNASQVSDLKKVDFRNLWWRHIHGIGGLLFVVSCALEIVLFLLRGQPTILMKFLIVLFAVPFSFGLFTKSFRHRMVRLADKRFVFYRAMVWIYALIGLAISVYTQPTFRVSEVPLQRWAFTSLLAISLFLSVLITIHELRKMTVFTEGFLTANISTYALLVTMPCLHLILGTDRLALLYNQYLIGDTVYVICLFTCLITSIDLFFLGMMTSRKIYIEQYKQRAVILWPGVYLTGMISLLGFLINWQTAVGYFVISMTIFGIGSQFTLPIHENQKGLLSVAAQKQEALGSKTSPFSAQIK